MNTKTIEERAASYDAQHPEVYKLLVRYAQEWKSKYSRRVGIELLYNKVRWEVSFPFDKTGGDKLQQGYAAYYARKIMKQNPDLDGIFRLGKTLAEGRVKLAAVVVE